jgi:cell division septal protein FtsQ
MSPVAAPSDRRFRRAHVKPARRRQWRRLTAAIVKCAVLLGVAAYAVHWGAGILTHARALQVDRIVVRGNRRVPDMVIVSALQKMRGQSLVWTDLGVWRTLLLETPWVRDAAFRRTLPSTVEVTIAEREPIGLGRVKGRLYLVDEKGVLIDEYGPEYADFDLPIVDGLDGADVAPRAELAARVIGSIRRNPEIAKRLSQVDVSDVHNASVIVAGDPAVLFLGEERFLQRLESYLEVAPALRERVDDIDGVDLRFENRVYVRPVKAARAAKVPALLPADARVPPARRRGRH